MDEQPAHDEPVEATPVRALHQVGRILAGSALVVAGLVMWVLPGPGLLTIAAGLALLGRDVPWAARLLERVRARLPQEADGRTHRGVLVASIAFAVLSVGTSLALLVA